MATTPPLTVRVAEPGRTPSPRDPPAHRHRPGLERCLRRRRTVPRRHLRLAEASGRLTVQDLGSTNGTRIDGSAGDQPDDDRCRAGGHLRPVPPGAGGTGSCGEIAVAPDRDPLLRQTSIDLVAAAAAESAPVAALHRAGTQTIVFSDIVDSTRLTAHLGDERWLRLLGFHNHLVRRHVDGGGIEVKAPGDGFMLAFPSARAAVLCSIEILRALEAHGRSHPTDTLRIHVGMHTGEAILEERGPVGSRWCWRRGSPTRRGAARSWSPRWCGRWIRVPGRPPLRHPRGRWSSRASTARTRSTRWTWARRD